MYPKLIENLIANFTKLPGVGRRSAERMVFWLLNHPTETAKQLADSIINLKENLRFCRQCNNLSELELCLVCNDSSRDAGLVCVVEEPKDLLAIERSGSFKGHYHVLLGTISPADGRGPDDIRVNQLLQRVAANTIREVVIATDPDNEGEMTALYLTQQLRSTKVKITRIGLGIPVGSSLEFADISTLCMSLSSRREILD